MRIAYILTVLFVAICFTSFAQPSWQWGKRGGSPVYGVGAGQDEYVKDIATDQNGNIYVLTDLWTPGLDIDGHPKSGYGGSDVVLSSFKCDGTFRWSKIMGGHQDDEGISVKTDTLGGVYITGYIVSNSSALFIDVDSSWAAGQHKSLFLAKFDTAGAYKWYRMPQADSVSGYSSSNSAIYDMDVEGDGTIYWFVDLAPGAYAGGAYIVPANTIHMLRYTGHGDFVSGQQMDISLVMTAGGASPFFTMRRNRQNGKIFVTGNRPYFTTITFGSTTFLHTLYIGCFNSSGALLWARENVNDFSNGPITRPDVDASGNVYLLAEAVNGDTLNAYPVVNPISGNGTLVAEKLDSAGNLIWGTNALTDAEDEAVAVILTGGEVKITGNYPLKTKWGADSLMHTGSCGYSPLIARFNSATGAFIGLDSLASNCGSDTRSTCATSDRSGNFYVGGFTQFSVTVNGTVLTTIGGGSDFFFAKYGSAICNCIPPVANFTAVGTHTVNFTYTGTATYDSVRWTFGDGGTSSIAAPTHTYTASGTYTVCVTVYTSCGSDTHCQPVTITIGPGSAPTVAFENVNIYPNPVTGQLTIDNMVEGAAIVLWNVMGEEVYNSKVTGAKQVINMQPMLPGTYIIRLTGKDGNRAFKTIMKQ